ncbi:Arc family DNA-binding protein [Pseudomonas sp. ANT_J12]|uniref:Arc family DNA-binding protein n=1 Tax=Pseudomonas sp. ANT_J12 TaxID=2597351 RepID=UPI0011F24727|nr:Arc family DNA-binding protein [Pseudomonas sp. ANT_J12]KAA0995436.1 Arc family DNA-binding protein [Pseudomonas sp. ANT_J12]
MEEIYRSQFRMPHSLYENLKTAADKNHRSVNAELVARLEESFALQPEPKFRGVDKNALLATIGESHTYSEQAIIEAMLLALRGVPPDAAKPEPNSGPKAKKRFPKE